MDQQGVTTNAFTYSSTGDMVTLTDGNANTATYSYLANAPLVGQIVFANSGATRMTTTKQYDCLNRLTQISSAPSAPGLLPLAYSYSYNTANQRTQNTFSDGSHWVYQYDSLGHVISGKRYWSDGTPVAGQQFDYTFDTIGNRTQTQSGGDTTGANLRVASYSANTLNQITSRTVPGTNDIVGAAYFWTNVTVNGQAADRKAEYYHGTIGTNNASSAAWLAATVVGAGDTVNGNRYLPQTPECFQYDADGNLTNDGRWYYTWDAENRLIGMIVNTNVGPQLQLSFIYDSKGRRIQKTVVSNSVPLYTNTFLYDNWNLIALLAPGSQLQSSFVWGNDLSGTLQGAGLPSQSAATAGGVGGLLETSYHGTSTTNAFVAYDGNGNVSALVNAADGTVLANYDYGPFGETIRSTGSLAKSNPFRFSTKYQDDGSERIYYGYRYYIASTGTWCSRDPIGEGGGLNLYDALDGDTINDEDAYGQKGSSITGSIINGATTYNYVINFGLDDKGNPSITELGIDNFLGPVGASVLEIKMDGAITGHIKCCPSPDNLNTIPISFDKHYGNNHWYFLKKEAVIYVRGSTSQNLLSCCISAVWDITITVEGQIFGVDPVKPIRKEPPIVIAPPPPPGTPPSPPKPPTPPPPHPKDPCASI